jgi:hypothetical protein
MRLAANGSDDLLAKRFCLHVRERNGFRRRARQELGPYVFLA